MTLVFKGPQPRIVNFHNMKFGDIGIIVDKPSGTSAALLGVVVVKGNTEIIAIDRDYQRSWNSDHGFPDHYVQLLQAGDILEYKE